MAGQRLGLIMAGGVGSRLGANVPKQMLHLGGKPILAQTIERIFRFAPTLRFMVVLHPSLLEEWEGFIEKHLAFIPSGRLQACAGGKERTESVSLGLEALASWEGVSLQDWVAIHDGVRPFVSDQLLKMAFETAEMVGNATVAVPVVNSLRKVGETGESEAVDRGAYFMVQTPQVFRLGEILGAYRNRPHDRFTDDASLAESAGMRIFLSPGDYANMKITTPEDLAIGEMIAQKFTPF